MVRLYFLIPLLSFLNLLGSSQAQDNEFYLHINFNEWMDTIGFTNPNNFIWTEGLETIEVSLNDTSTAYLKISLPEINKWYTLEVSNVFDRSGNVIDPDKDTMGCILRYIPLPVELSSFTAKHTNEEVFLKWTTKTEVNNYGFEVERNVNGAGWLKIGFVTGHGNSNSPKYYSFTDDNLVGGSMFHYRLKQIDTDGKFEYSDVVDIEIIPDEFILYQNYPNPFNPSTIIKYQLPKESIVEIKIFDITGEILNTLLSDVKPMGTYVEKFTANNISSGIYMYNLVARNPKRISEIFFNETKKMIVLH